MLPFTVEKQNLLMHVLHDLHQGLGWGDQYFRFGRIQQNAGKKAAKIQIINSRVSVAAGLHEVSPVVLSYSQHHCSCCSQGSCCHENKKERLGRWAIIMGGAAWKYRQPRVLLRTGPELM